MPQELVLQVFLYGSVRLFPYLLFDGLSRKHSFYGATPYNTTPSSTRFSCIHPYGDLLNGQVLPYGMSSNLVRMSSQLLTSESYDRSLIISIEIVLSN